MSDYEFCASGLAASGAQTVVDPITFARSPMLSVGLFFRNAFEAHKKWWADSVEGALPGILPGHAKTYIHVQARFAPSGRSTVPAKYPAAHIHSSVRVHLKCF